MDNNQNNTAASAEALASQFKVGELEPRQENMWSGGRDDASQEHATPASGCTP